MCVLYKELLAVTLLYIIYSRYIDIIIHCIGLCTLVSVVHFFGVFFAGSEYVGEIT